MDYINAARQNADLFITFNARHFTSLRREKRLMVVSNVPAGVCRQCGEKYFKPEVLKRMDSLYHGIFERNEKPDRTLSVPGVSL